MECKICLDNFDNLKRKPSIIKDCGHTYCAQCIIQLTKKNCPECRTVITGTVTNYAVLNSVELYLNEQLIIAQSKQLSLTQNNIEFQSYSQAVKNVSNKDNLTEQQKLITNIKNNWYVVKKPTKTFKGHTDVVCSLAVVKNDILASGSYDKTIRIWKNDITIKILTEHTESVYCLAVLPNLLLASGSGDKTIRIWNITNETSLKILYGHTDAICSLVLLQNGTSLASGSADNTIRIWIIKSGETQLVLKGHTNRIWSLVVLKNGNLASGSGDKTIRIWNTATGDLLKVLDEHDGGIWSLTVQSNGNLISGSWDKSIRIWNTNNGKILKVLHGHSGVVSSLSALKDDYLASTSYDKTIRIWNCDGKCIKIFNLYSDSECLAVLNDGTTLANGQWDNTINLWSK
jgi:WD40 repeat protein